MRTVHLIKFGLIILLFLAVWNVGQAQDSLAMHHVASLVYWSDANDIHMVGDLAYVMGGLSGLHIMSLADSANPIKVGRYTRPQGINYSGVYVTGDRAYLSLYDTGVVLDVSDPASLITLGEWDATANFGISDITLVYGDIAIAESDESMAYVLDVSDPTNVHYIGTFSEASGPMDALGMAGEYLCMKGWPGGVILYDISDPTQPQRVAACDTACTARYGTLSGNYAYVATRLDGLHIIDLTNPLQPALIAVCDSSAGNVTVTGPHAIITRGGIRIWNVADPFHPVFEGALGIGGGKISSSGNLVCAQQWGGNMSVSVIDISNPAAPAMVSEFGNYGILKQLVISSTVGYIADYHFALRTIDLADPNHISELDNMHGRAALAWSVAVRGNYAYEAVGPWGLNIIDISNPAQLDSIWSLNLPQMGNILKVLTVGDYLYAFDFRISGPSYIQTFHLANPEVPELVNSLAIPQLFEGSAFGVTASNGYLYFVQYNYLKVYSLANPAAPQLVGSCGLPLPNLYAYAHRVVVTGNYAYVANCGGGLVVVNIANPSSPTIVTSIEGYYSEVAVSENVLIVDNPYSGIQIMDISNPTNPTIIGYYSTYEFLVDMDVRGQYLFTTSESDFHVYQVDALTGTGSPQEITPHEFALYPCYPNPFNPGTVIRFSLPYTTHAELTVYDVTGRQVKVLANGVLSEGEHNITFDGSALSSGVYFVRLEAGNQMQAEKMVVLK